MKKYLKTQDGQELKVEVYYSLGGSNYFTSTVEARGYYLSVTPISRGGGYTETKAFSGIKKLIKEVKRKSMKAEQEAIELAPLHEEELIEHVLQKNNLKLA